MQACCIQAQHITAWWLCIHIPVTEHVALVAWGERVLTGVVGVAMDQVRCCAGMEPGQCCRGIHIHQLTLGVLVLLAALSHGLGLGLACGQGLSYKAPLPCRGAHQLAKMLVVQIVYAQGVAMGQ